MDGLSCCLGYNHSIWKVSILASVSIEGRCFFSKVFYQPEIEVLCKRREGDLVDGGLSLSSKGSVVSLSSVTPHD
jgi:hypothetical protein